MLERLAKNQPKEIALRFRQMKEWGLPEDTWHYLLSKNLVALIERAGDELGFRPPRGRHYYGTPLPQP